jgi:hypothetical protein
MGMNDKTITFETSGTVKLNQDSVKTGSDGTFTVEGKALPSQEASLHVTARFDGDPEYQSSISHPLTFVPEGNMPTVIELDQISYVNLGGTIDVHGTLMSRDGAQGVSGRIIKLTEPKVESSVPDTTLPEEVIKSIDPKALNKIPAPTSQSSTTDTSGKEFTTTTESDGKFTFLGIGKHEIDALWKVQARFDGDTEYGPTSDDEIYSSTKDIVVIEAQDIVYEQRPNEKELGIELPIPDPDDLPDGCELLTIDEDHDDALNEIEITGTTLNFDSRDKSESKIIEYSVFYDCKDQTPVLQPQPVPPPDEDPDTSIDSAIDGENKAVTDGSSTTSDSITFTFSGTPASDIDHFVCSIEGVPEINPCVSPKLFYELGAKPHTLTVAAVDAVGRKDQTPAKFEWTVDTPAPDTSIDSAIVGENKAVTDGGKTTSDSITFTFSGTPASDIDHFVCSIDGGAEINPCVSPNHSPELGIIPAPHTFTVAAVDAVGKKDQTPAKFQWTIVLEIK